MMSTQEIIEDSHLVFVSPAKGGIWRHGEAGNFSYLKASGAPVNDELTLQRITKLVLPPAWTNVWISHLKNGYLQAVGHDVAGRKQYRYHPDWVKRRSNHKYFRLLSFGKSLPKARAIVAKDLKRKEWDERKVLALCISVLQHTLIRVGNAAYEKNYKSFGLSTLKDKHFKQEGSVAFLSFVGKKGVAQELQLSNKKLIDLIKKSRDIPGKDLFQFYVDGKEKKAVTYSKINDYIREITGQDFTAKDFRTWGGTLEAMRQFAICNAEGEACNTKTTVNSVLDCVAAKLGNTRTVCKSSYVYPELIAAFEAGELNKYLQKINRNSSANAEIGYEDEKVLMQFLSAVEKKK